ncbi:hypothetical protein QJQ45_016371 [Haematococcus lacustris]|nr:hypothetical protein QJQ45_016371 [Haematococcus lacustris]
MQLHRAPGASRLGRGSLARQGCHAVSTAYFRPQCTLRCHSADPQARLTELDTVGAAPVWTDSLSETQRYVLADEWGFSSVGTSLPAGIAPEVLVAALPEDVLEPQLGRAMQGFLAPVALIALGLSWQWYMHSIMPVWQQLATWVCIGTGYAGLFQLAQECAKGCFLPEFPATQDLVGSLLMAPSLNSFEVWRLRLFDHHIRPTELWGDSQGSCHPLTLQQLAAAHPWQRLVMRLVATTPLKLLMSLGDWVDGMQHNRRLCLARLKLQGWDLREVYVGLRISVLMSWVLPAAVLGLGLPCLLVSLGWEGVINCWLGPWLVFHCWLSTLNLLRHTAPHIPWRARGLKPRSYDHSRAIISHTVTTPLPGWLESLLNFPNYPVPGLLLWSGVPYYHAKAATAALREKLGPYMNEAPLSIRLLTNHITKWHVFDTDTERYLTWEEAERRLEEQQLDQRKESLGAHGADDGAAHQAVGDSPIGNGSFSSSTAPQMSPAHRLPHCRPFIASYLAMEGAILCLGNPLLDVSASVDSEFMAKYDLKPANQILAEPKHLPMYEELAAKPSVEYIAGGAGQNSIRVAQWMLQVPQATAYMGCIGDDEFGRTMTATAKADGVNVRYMVDPSTPTGTCAVCITGIERSLVANLAAANNFKADFALANFDLVEAARIIYCTGFFITVSPDSIAAVAKHAAEHDKIYAMNLSAPFIVQVPPFKKVLMDSMPYIDFLFANEVEAAAFAESEGWDAQDLEQVALKVSRLPKANGCRPRTVVFTQGAQPSIVAVGGRTTLYPVPKIAPDLIVDTNGAGDAFVGGFLSQLVYGKDVAECCRAGNYAASVIIQRSGCTFPAKPSFKWA